MPKSTTTTQNKKPAASKESAAKGVAAAVKKAVAPKKATAAQKSFTFKIFSPESSMVEIGGDFNDWTPSKTRLKKDKEGYWSGNVKLKPGKYQYKVVYDGGSWELDPNQPIIQGEFGPNNLIEV